MSASWQIPLTDVAMPDEDVQAVLECLRGGWLTMGPRTAELESQFARWTGAPHAIAVSSGTAALHLALLACGLGEGDEVITADLTFVASTAAARYVGATPILCDSLGPRDMNMDPDDVRRRITLRTRAVIATHFMGYPAALAELRALCDQHGLWLIEDAAQAIGARTSAGPLVGTVGDVGCFSFFSKKQLCTGEGGMVTCADQQIADRVRSLRSHAMTTVTWERHRGYAESYDVIDVGFNYRIDEPRAALALSRLRRLREDIERRRELVHRYRAGLADVEQLQLSWSEADVKLGSHFAFPVLAHDAGARDQLRERLRERGVQTTAYPAISTFSAYRDAGGGERARALAARHLALPLWSAMEDFQQERVLEALRDSLSAPRDAMLAP